MFPANISAARSLLLLALVFCLPRLLFAQQPFVRDVWLSEAGMPLRVADMAQDADGGLWLATEAGLASFNGRNALFGTEKEPLSAVCFHQGRLCAGSPAGAVYRYDGPTRTLLFRAGVEITSLQSTIYGLLICTGGEGVYLATENGVLHFDSRLGLPDDYVYRAAPWGQSMVLATDRGLVYVAPLRSGPDGRLDVFLTTGGDIARVVTSGGDPRADLWAGYQEAGISLRRAPEAWPARETSLPAAPWQWGPVSDILPLDDETWIGTAEGFLVRIDAGRPADYAAVRLPGRKINRLLRDRTGNVWAATNAGLSLVSGSYLQRIPLPPPFSVHHISSLATDREGRLWYAQDRQLLAYDPAIGSMLRTTTPAPVTCCHADSIGRMWIGTSGGGLLCRESTGRVQKVSGIPNLEDAHILSIAGAAGSIWVSGLNGVEELQLPPDGSLTGIRVRHHGKREGIGSDYVYRIYTDRSGRIWFATDGAGVAMFDARGYHRWDSAAGFSSRVVYSITEDAFGNIWAGTLSDGLLRYDGERWKRFGKREGLEDATIHTVAANGSGQVLAVGARGLSIWYPADSAFRHYNRRSGLGIDSFSEALNASASARSGEVYLPYNGGLLRFGLVPVEQSIRPGMRITSVQLFFKPTDTALHNFSPDQNQIGFAFEGINFAHGERLHYRYRLEGLTSDWTETGDAAVTFPQLPPGRYRFCVQASLDPGFAHAAAAEWSFTILTPLWKRWWLLLPGAFGLAALAALLLRARVRAVRKVSLLEQERLRFEYEHLRSQVNPHFLFNSLNTLTGLIEEDPAAAAHYTEQLSDFYRNSLALHNRDLVPLREELDLLERYFFIQHSRFGDALQLDVAVPDACLEKRIVPLALQLLAENAIKHNVVSRAHPLIIRITVAADHITVSNAVREKSGEKAKGTELGLENIRKRYALTTPRPVGIRNFNDEFAVTLPLL